MVTGEPGIGKTRLVAELFGWLDQQTHIAASWRQGRCQPYGEDVSFWPLRDIVKAQAGILDNDPAGEVERKLDRALSAGPDKASILSRIRPLVGLDAPAATQEENFGAWVRLLEQVATRRPLVLVVEDLHWADAAMLAFLRALITAPLRVPLLLVLTARTQFADTAGELLELLDAHELVKLAPLAPPLVSRLVTGLLDDSSLPSGLAPSIADRCGGNPLYAEQLVRLLGELPPSAQRRPALREAVESGLPESLRAVIAARIDALPPPEKALLAVASVVGRRFWEGPVAALWGDGEDMEDGLGRLTTAELIRPAFTSSVGGQREFVFWHALTQDVAYHQVPRDTRATMHERVAVWFERECGERAEDHADMLAHHYVRAIELRHALREEATAARLVAPAVHYLRLAALHALSLDVAAAERFASRAVMLAPPARPITAWRCPPGAMPCCRPASCARHAMP